MRQLGEYTVPVRLMAGVVAEVKVRVLNEEGEIPELPDWEEAEGEVSAEAAPSGEEVAEVASESAA